MEDRLHVQGAVPQITKMVENECPRGTKRVVVSQLQITEYDQGGCLAFAELQDSLLLAFDSLKMGSHNLSH